MQIFIIKAFKLFNIAIEHLLFCIIHILKMVKMQSKTFSNITAKLLIYFMITLIKTYNCFVKIKNKTGNKASVYYHRLMLKPFQYGL